MGAFYNGRIENHTFDPNLLPYGKDQRDYSPKGDRHQNKDIEGTTPNAYGNARKINGKDYLDISDIPGTKPRYIEVAQRRARQGLSMEKRREGTDILNVKDINSDGKKARHLYKREVDPLNPIYNLPSWQPAGGLTPAADQRRRNASAMNSSSLKTEENESDI